MYRKIQRVQKVLKDAALHTQKFTIKSSLSCTPGCFHCCTKKDISASPLEFLPLAYSLYKSGQADEVYEKLDSQQLDSICYLFSPFVNNGGGCQDYSNRGLICRLFGFSANHDKQGNSRLITCKILKDSYSYSKLTPVVVTKAPMATDYYMRLSAIDFKLANEQMQINQAIKRAIEIVSTYYMYRRRKRRA